MGLYHRSSQQWGFFAQHQHPPEVVFAIKMWGWFRGPRGCKFFSVNKVSRDHCPICGLPLNAVFCVACHSVEFIFWPMWLSELWAIGVFTLIVLCSSSRKHFRVGSCHTRVRMSCCQKSSILYQKYQDYICWWFETADPFSAFGNLLPSLRLHWDLKVSNEHIRKLRKAYKSIVCDDIWPFEALRRHWLVFWENWRKVFWKQGWEVVVRFIMECFFS